MVVVAGWGVGVSGTSVVEVSAWNIVVLLIGGFFAGVINSMAGGGSMLTVPLLSLAGVGGTVANGTNRVAVLIQNTSSAFAYARRGVGDWRATMAAVVPVTVGGLAGAVFASRLDGESFERVFGVLMVPLLVLSLWKPSVEAERDPWPPWLAALVFLAVGFYGGAIQAGVGLIFLLVLARAGFDLVAANAMKTILILAITLVALPVFVFSGQVRWVAAVVLSVGMAAGGYVGANLAVEGGERLIRPVLIVVVLALAARMVGLWDLPGG